MKTLLPLSLAAMLLASTAVSAQSIADFNQVDSDGDGKVSFSDMQIEWPDLTQDQFDAADLDGDDFLDLGQYDALMGMMSAEPSVAMSGSGVAPAMTIDAPNFQLLDKDGDGKIAFGDLTDWPEVTEAQFEVADMDGDDFLDATQYEALKHLVVGAGSAQPAAMGMTRTSGSLPDFAVVDPDGDGLVDFTTLRTELPNLTQAQFDAADIDGDSFLDRAQYAALNG